MIYNNASIFFHFKKDNIQVPKAGRNCDFKNNPFVLKAQTLSPAIKSTVLCNVFCVCVISIQ